MPNRISSTQDACTWQCALRLVAIDKAKREQKEKRDGLQKLKTLSDHLADAQLEFNGFIRTRDHGKPCISCDRMHGGQMQAGHYRSVGAAPHLRFNEDNCHAQCVPCNKHKSGNATEYRIHLVRRIGEARVEALENNNTPANYTKADAIRIKLEYRAKRRSLEAKNRP